MTTKLLVILFTSHKHNCKSKIKSVRIYQKNILPSYKLHNFFCNRTAEILSEQKVICF